MVQDGIIKRRGLMLVLSSPSGAGKTTISRRLLDQESNLTLSISATTRPPRKGERDGVDYQFVDNERFHAMVEAGEFLEHARVFGNLYGTPRAPVEEALKAGRDVLFDIDWQGTQQLRESARDDVVSVFVLPPSMKDLINRLNKRASDPVHVIKKRMSKSLDEMSHWAEYDYIVINDEVDGSIQKVQSILHSERLRRDRQTGLRSFVDGLANESSQYDDFESVPIGNGQNRDVIFNGPTTVYFINSENKIDVDVKSPKQDFGNYHLNVDIARLSGELSELRECIRGDNELLSHRAKQELSSEVSSAQAEIESGAPDISRLKKTRTVLLSLAEYAARNSISNYLTKIIDSVVESISTLLSKL